MLHCIRVADRLVDILACQHDRTQNRGGGEDAKEQFTPSSLLVYRIVGVLDKIYRRISWQTSGFTHCTRAFGVFPLRIKTHESVVLINKQRYIAYCLLRSPATL